MNLQQDERTHSSSTDIQALGTLYYERGFEIVDISGWMREEGSDWVLVYGNPDLPANDQPRTAVLKRRVVDIELAGPTAPVV